MSMAWLGEESAESIAGSGCAEKHSLGVVAPQFPQRLRLVRGFHTLGRHGQSQFVGERHDRTDDLGVCVRRRRAADR